MTKADWLSLVTTDDLYGELSLVQQQRKLLLFGALLMRRVWPFLDESVRRIVEIAEQCAAGTVNPRELRFGAAQLVADSAWFAARASKRLLRVVAPGGPLENQAVRHAELLTQYETYRDVIGDPTAPARPSPFSGVHHPALPGLLAALRRAPSPDPLTLAAVADLLEEVGCEDDALLAHLRDDSPHVAGCWAVERVLGRELIQLPLDGQKSWWRPAPLWWRGVRSL
jgi:hypothetical protein